MPWMLPRNGGRRLRTALASALPRIPAVGARARRFLLLERVLLADAAGDRRHGVAELELGDAPSPIVFAHANHGRLIEACRYLLDGDPFGLAGYPAADSPELYRGGLLGAGPDRPDLLYLPPRDLRCELQDARLNLDHGGLCTRAGAMVRDFVPRSRRGPVKETEPLNARWLPRSPTRLEGCYTTVWAKWAGLNYFHWLIDGLPRLAALHKIAASRPMTLLVPETMPSAWEDALACCLPEGMATQRASGWVQPERFILVSPRHISPAPWLTAEERKYLRQRVFDSLQLDPDAQPTRRLYISRSGAAIRRVANEAAVQQTLASFGFETVQPERLSFAQQARLFHEARCIVGAHGAGFANLLFAGRARVLELFSRDGFKPLYFFLCHSLGLQHDFLCGGAGNRREDFSVDVDDLKRSVDVMLAAAATD
ncbi:MAG: glycosyltransferase family 61 protein [Lysobacterales bacterium]|nr:MAG: glycosyltransferase family 61 protein [Xanthomonadales bacterium]